MSDGGNRWFRWLDERYQLSDLVEFAKHKAASTQTTPYGLQYSPHYSRQSHEQK